MTPPAHRSILLTPPAAGAIAVIRVLGDETVALVNQVFRPKAGKQLCTDEADRLRYGHFVDGEEVIDDVIASVTTIRPPQSPLVKGGGSGSSPRTVVDICCHGGVRVVERILQTLEGLGAPACEPFAAMDEIWPARNAIEREAIEAMCLAKTQRALAFLAHQRAHLATALVRLAEKATTDAAAARRGLEEITAGFLAAQRLLHGAVVALLGPPNSGKSTLFNRLLGRGGAIVSPVAGTTRDWVAEPIEIEGVPITLVDTAGRHETHDPLEALAVEAGQRIAADADLHVLVLDAADSRVAAWQVDAGRPTITLLNKCDLARTEGLVRSLQVSAKTGLGVDILLSRMLGALGFSQAPNCSVCLFTDRQLRLAERASIMLGSAPAAARRLIVDELIGHDARMDGAIIPPSAHPGAREAT